MHTITFDGCGSCMLCVCHPCQWLHVMCSSPLPMMISTMQWQKKTYWEIKFAANPSLHHCSCTFLFSFQNSCRYLLFISLMGQTTWWEVYRVYEGVPAEISWGCQPPLPLWLLCHWLSEYFICKIMTSQFAVLHCTYTKSIAVWFCWPLHKKGWTTKPTCVCNEGDGPVTMIW